MFSGNANLVYTIIRKRHVFHALANLPSDIHGISKCLNNRKSGQNIRIASNVVSTSRKKVLDFDQSSVDNDAPVSLESNATTPTPPNEEDEVSDAEIKHDLTEASMEGSRPALPAEPGTLKVSLLDTPAIGQMTERESAHPLQTTLCDFNAGDNEIGASSSSGSSSSNVNTVQPKDVEEVEDVIPSTESQGTNSLKRTVNQVFSLYFYFQSKM